MMGVEGEKLSVLNPDRDLLNDLQDCLGLFVDLKVFCEVWRCLSGG